MSLIIKKKTAFGIWENKGADHREACQRLCFHYMDSTIPLLYMPLAIFCGCTTQLKCWTWSETQKTGFLAMQLILLSDSHFSALDCWACCCNSLHQGDVTAFYSKRHHFTSVMSSKFEQGLHQGKVTTSYSARQHQVHVI